MLKWKISKQAYDDMEDSMKSLYKASGDGYQLQAEADPRVSELDTQLKAIQRDLDKRKDFIDPASVPDVSSIQAMLDAEKTGRASDVDRLQGFIASALVNEKATELSGKIFKNPSVMKRFVTDSLTVDFTGATPSVKVKGADGKLSDDFDALAKTFSSNPDYADFVIASKAGGGAGNKTPAFSKPQGEQNVDLAKSSAYDLVQRIDARNSNKGA